MLLCLAQVVSLSEEFRRRCGPGDSLSEGFITTVLSSTPHQRSTARQRLLLQKCRSRAEALGFVASFPENLDCIEPFYLLYPNGAPPADDSAYALWTCLREDASAVVSRHAPRTENAPAFDFYMVVAPDSLRDAVQTLHALAGQAGVGWRLHVTTDADSFRMLAGVMRQEKIVGDLIQEDAGLLAGNSPWLAFLEPGDRLEAGALDRIVDSLRFTPDTVLLFTDEDRIDENGNHVHARLKAAWSDDQLLFGDTVGDFAVFSRQRVQEVLPDVRVLSDGDRQTWLYALKLAVVEGIDRRRVCHSSGILFHRLLRREVPELTRARAKEVASDHLARHRPDVRLLVSFWVPPMPDGSQRLRVEYPLPKGMPSVTVIIPTRDRPDLLRACLDGVLHHTDYARLEVLVVDNGSVEAETLALLEEIAAYPCVTVLRDDGVFNWARLNNEAVAGSESDLVLFLNDDVFVRHSDWLEDMVRQILRPGVGVVGARLLYPDDTVQHAGIVVTRDGATHLLRGAAAADAGYLDVLAVQRDLLAVTGACLLMRRSLFVQVGGLDEEFAVSCNDIDLCLRTIAAGWRVVWTPHATLTHLDGGTRGRDATPQQVVKHWGETARLVGRWHALMGKDPTLNPALRVTDHDLLLAEAATWRE
nr:glycosyltransferase family 2 protein [Acetobacter conturbans]